MVCFLKTNRSGHCCRRAEIASPMGATKHAKAKDHSRDALEDVHSLYQRDFVGFGASQKATQQTEIAHGSKDMLSLTW